MKTYWTINSTLARLNIPVLTGEVDAAYPWRGFELAASKAPHVALLKVQTRAIDADAPEAMLDLYQRGEDLVATYAETAERNVRRKFIGADIDAAHDAAGLEVILSAQTSLLDSQPATHVGSALPPGEAIVLNERGTPVEFDAQSPRAVLFRPEYFAMSYLEMVHPTDFAGVQLENLGGLNSVRWRLFPESLEKGVIRRGRVRGLFLPRDSDLDQAPQLLADFAASPLVLST